MLGHQRGSSAIKVLPNCSAAPLTTRSLSEAVAKGREEGEHRWGSAPRQTSSCRPAQHGAFKPPGTQAPLQGVCRQALSMLPPTSPTSALPRPPQGFTQRPTHEPRPEPDTDTAHGEPPRAGAWVHGPMGLQEGGGRPVGLGSPGPQFPGSTPADATGEGHGPHPDLPMPLRADHMEKREASSTAQNHERILLTEHHAATFKSRLKTDEGFSTVQMKVGHMVKSPAPRVSHPEASWPPAQPSTVRPLSPSPH